VKSGVVANTSEVASAKNLKYQSVEVTVMGGGARVFSILPSASNANAFMIQMKSYRFMDNKTAIQVDESSGKVFEAVSDLMSGKINFMSEVEFQPNYGVLFGTRTSLDLVTVSGASEMNQLAADDAAKSAMNAINQVIDDTLVKQVSEVAQKSDCSSLKFEGTWDYSIVVKSDVIKVRSIIGAATVNSDGSQSMKGTETADGKSLEISYEYSPTTCVLATTTGDQHSLMKVVFVGSTTRQLVKLAFCADAACEKVNGTGKYTDSVILKRVK
jgi:hypothetical protein